MSLELLGAVPFDPAGTAVADEALKAALAAASAPAPAYGDNMVEAFHANRTLAPKAATPADAPRPLQGKPGSAYAVPLLAGGVGLGLVALLVAIFTGRRR